MDKHILIIIKEENIDSFATFTDENYITEEEYKTTKKITILLDFVISNPYILDYNLNTLYTIFRGKITYDVDIDILYKFDSSSRDVSRLETLIKANNIILLSESYPQDGIECDRLITYTPSLLKELPDYEMISDKMFNYKEFKISAVGGTFDHLHDGHKILLALSTFLTSKKLMIGLTSEKLLVNKKYKEMLESFDTRKSNLLQFLNILDPSVEYEVVPINDVCGPTGYEPNIEALIVSRETSSGGDFVNKTRLEKGLAALNIFVVNVLGGKEKLSSTTIREIVSHNK